MVWAAGSADRQPFRAGVPWLKKNGSPIRLLADVGRYHDRVEFVRLRKRHRTCRVIPHETEVEESGRLGTGGDRFENGFNPASLDSGLAANRIHPRN